MNFILGVFVGFLASVFLLVVIIIAGNRVEAKKRPTDRQVADRIEEARKYLRAVCAQSRLESAHKVATKGLEKLGER